MPPPHGCPQKGPPSPEVTEAFCLVPSTLLSQSPKYPLLVHLWRFRVRSIQWGYFLVPLQCLSNPIRIDTLQDTSLPTRLRNINLIPIDYGFRPRLRGRLTLRGLTCRRKPWTYGDSVSHTVFVTHVSILTSDTSTPLHRDASSAYGTLRYHRGLSPLSTVSAYGLSPVTSSAQNNLSRPVSCYAFFKGWLLLSQPPGCHDRFTSFPT